MRGEWVRIALFDIGAEVDLERVHTILGRPAAPAPFVARSPAPDYAPVPRPREVAFEPPESTPGTKVEVRVHAVGVVAVRIRLPLEAGSLDTLPEAKAGFRAGGRGLKEASSVYVEQVRAELQGAVIEPYPGLVEPEFYGVYCLTEGISADQLLGRDREPLAALIAGEPPGLLVPAVVDAALKHTLRYYRDDAVVIGWDNAVILGHPGGYEDVLDVLELANLQLLEFRTYDAYLDRRLDESFAALDRLWKPGGFLRSARATLQDISELRVDFARLTDNLHDTSKLFGEWYLAKLHTHLRESFHLASWEKAVAAKMQTMEDMFQLAEEEANHRRSIFLEGFVILLFILDLVMLYLLRT
jgi:hypothetical protein